MTALEFESVSVPEELGETLLTKKQTYNRSAAGKAARTKYRHNNSKHQTDASYLSRPIRAIDGEGVTLEDGSHIYTLLSLMNNADHELHSISSDAGLDTKRIFNFLLNYCADGAINAIYGGSYDFNMWLSDFSEDDLRELYQQEFYKWRGFLLQWRSGKTFYIRRLDILGKPTGKGVTIYDVVSFFQCPFVAACDSYLGERFLDRERIVQEKANRGTFRIEDAESVATYNRSELLNLLMLVEELRSRLNKVNLRPRRWDGPGAVAAALLEREKVKDCKAECPPAVAQAARFAYAGGRFEVIRFGHVRAPAYEYDVNSAYPSALRFVPDLSAGTWVHHKGEPKNAGMFTLYRIAFKSSYHMLPAPLFCRLPKGSMAYPLQVVGWYWSPEYYVTRDYCEAVYAKWPGKNGKRRAEYEVLEAWEFVPSTDRKPFAFIEPLYNKRRALKKAGDGAHVGIKLALNSLYGKLAQQVGFSIKNGRLRIPPYHQLEWAGFVTSYCRAKVLGAVLNNLEHVIAFETDAVFTSVPLDVPLSSNLGDFEETVFEDLTYVQSGLYFGGQSETNIAKTRGIDRGNLSRGEVLDGMRKELASERVARVSLTRFVGAGIALSQNYGRWRRWETASKEISLEPTGKRMHAPGVTCNCKNTSTDPGIDHFRWHTTMCPFLRDPYIYSEEYPVAWINPNEKMVEMEEARSEPTEWE